ncbi:MAG: LacI family DNA-binding transcriptional regulator [Bacillota bacterium]|nr:LacI family DNA-binding transcriptional regulator [Bacillota bacterium]
MKATIRDVAKLAGVSVATVSRVINKLGGVRPETEQRIEKAMEELQYIPNVLARSVASKKTKLIGMIVPDVENPFFAAVFSGADKVVREYAYTTLLGGSNDTYEREENLLQTMLEHQASGILLTPTFPKAKWVERMGNRVPTCLIDRDMEGMNCDRVLIDNRRGTYEATKLFIQKGHTQLAIITGPLESTPGRERFEGFKQCLHDFSIELNQDYIQIGDFHSGSGYQLGKRLLKLNHPPTAILSCNNLMTIGLLEMIHTSSIRLGEDLGVIGFDDIPIATLMHPNLTVVSRPMREMGECAAEMLLQRIQNPNQPNRTVIMSPHLIVRGSESIFS